MSAVSILGEFVLGLVLSYYATRNFAGTVTVLVCSLCTASKAEGSVFTLVARSLICEFVGNLLGYIAVFRFYLELYFNYSYNGTTTTGTLYNNYTSTTVPVLLQTTTTTTTTPLTTAPFPQVVAVCTTFTINFLSTLFNVSILRFIPLP